MAMERENRPARGAGKRRKKVCQFCVDKCECTKKTCRKAGLFLRPDRPFSSIYHAFSPL